MIQTAPAIRILVAVQSVDLRRGIDGLAVSCRQGLEELEENPMSGCAFVFRDRRGTAVKVLEEHTGLRCELSGLLHELLDREREPEALAEIPGRR